MLAIEQVKQAVEARLLGATSAGSRVTTLQAWPASAAALPRLRLVDRDEQIESDDTTWPTMLEHTLQLDVEGEVEAIDGLGAALNALAAQVLVALCGTQAASLLSPLPNCAVVPRGIAREGSADAQATLGRITVRFDVHFQTASNDPETLI